MKFSFLFLFFFFLAISLAFQIPLVSSLNGFGYDNPFLPQIEEDIYIKQGGDNVHGTYNFNGGYTSGGLSIIGGDLYAHVGHFYNITSIDITRQNLTIIDFLNVDGNVSADYFFGNFTYAVGIGENYLNLSGTNANQNIDISMWNLTVGSLRTNGDIDITDGALDMNDGRIHDVSEIVMDPGSWIRGFASSTVVFADDIDPRHDGSYDIGNATRRFRNLYLEGNISTIGNVSASYFFGDGSQLSNIPGGNASWNESHANTLYASIDWGYNQSDGSYNITYQNFAYNQSLWNLSGSNLYQKNLAWNVGIGTDTPQQELNVIGDGNFTGNVSIGGMLDVKGNSSANWFNGKFNWTSKNIYIDFDGATATFNEAQLNTTILDLTKSEVYNATTIDTIEGTLDWGDINSILIPEDSLTYNVSEAAGANPLIININITGVDNFDSIIGRIYYQGGQGHEMQLEVQRQDNGAWENYYEETDTTDFINFYVPVFDPVNHIYPGGNVSIRFSHAQIGNPSHNFFIDYLAIVDGFTALTISDHDALGGRDNIITNHPDMWNFTSRINNTLSIWSYNQSSPYDDFNYNMTISGGGNASWNESYAATLYVNMTGDTITGNLTVIGDFNVTGRFLSPFNKTVTVAEYGGDYISIQDALDANTGVGVLVIVYPGVYVGDTIHFTANNQRVEGISYKIGHSEIETRNVNAVVNFSDYIGTGIAYLYFDATDDCTKDNDLIVGHGKMQMEKIAMLYSITGNCPSNIEPSILSVGGHIKAIGGHWQYRHLTATAGDIKPVINLISDLSDVELKDVWVDALIGNAALASTIVYSDQATPDFASNYAKLSVTDSDSDYAVIAYLPGGGSPVFQFNRFEVASGGATKAYGIWLTGTASVTSIYNNYNIAGGVENYYANIGATASFHSKYDNVIAVDGSKGAGTITRLVSPSFGNFTISDSIVEDLNLDGNLTIAAGSDYLVGDNEFAFIAAVDHDAGLRFDVTNVMFDFVNSGGAETASFGAGTATHESWIKQLRIGDTLATSEVFDFEVQGNTNFTGNITTYHGGALLIPSDQYAFRSLAFPNIGTYFNATGLIVNLQNNLLENQRFGVGTTGNSSWFRRGIGISEGSAFAPSYPLHITINKSEISVYTQAGVSASDFIDRTEFPDDDYNATKDILKIKSNGLGQLDHSTLSNYIFRNITNVPIYETKKDPKTGIWEDVVVGYENIEGRSMSNMISINTKALQELIDRIEYLEANCVIK